jgi:hypothetical protein
MAAPPQAIIIIAAAVPPAAMAGAARRERAGPVPAAAWSDALADVLVSFPVSVLVSVM